MTAYEIVMIIIGIITLMITFGKFIISLLSFMETFIERKDKETK